MDLEVDLISKLKILGKEEMRKMVEKDLIKLGFEIVYKTKKTKSWS